MRRAIPTRLRRIWRILLRHPLSFGPPMQTLPSVLPPLLAQAIEASSSGDTDLALSLFAQAAQDPETSAWAHFLMGSEYAALGKMDEAEAAFSTAVLLAPGLLVARYQLGLLQFSSGRVPAAFLTWQPLLESDPDTALCQWIKGFAALARDEFDAARSHFKTGLQLNTDNPPMSTDIQRVIAEIDQLMASSGNAPAPTPGFSDGAEEGDAAHVLLSNYQTQGSQH
jgi:tetratricopeptide (TPR) repeat protein